ncbi:MAG: alpha/beta hydrolase [Actinomycetales bacterium]|nr:alpha/beta hydrolase [Actinomycetales bacterium]
MPLIAPHAESLAEVPARDGRLRVLGSDTWYRVYGPEDAARTLVFVHGYRGDHHGLEPVVARLPQYRIIAPDLPGFGHSSAFASRPHSVDSYVRWLRLFVAALEAAGEIPVAGREVVLGHSFGSIVVAHALAEGLEAAGVILVNPITSDPRRATNPVLLLGTRGYYALGRALPERAGRAWLGWGPTVAFMSLALTKTKDPSLRRWIREEHSRYFSNFASPATASEGFEASLSAHVTEVAARITAPTLLIAGERDDIAPLAGQRRALEEFPDARLEVIPDVGHLIHYEQPARAAELIAAFVDGLPARS